MVAGRFDRCLGFHRGRDPYHRPSPSSPSAVPSLDGRLVGRSSPATAAMGLGASSRADMAPMDTRLMDGALNNTEAVPQRRHPHSHQTDRGELIRMHQSVKQFEKRGRHCYELDPKQSLPRGCAGMFELQKRKGEGIVHVGAAVSAGCSPQPGVGLHPEQRCSAKVICRSQTCLPAYWHSDRAES